MKVLLWTSTARTDLGNLDRTNAARVYADIHKLADTGEGDVKALHGSLKGRFRLRSGPLRIHFDCPTPDTIRVHRIEKRGDAYRH